VTELTVLKEFGAALDGDSRGPSPQLRARLVGQFSVAPAARRRVRRVALAAGLAALATVALLASSTLWLWGAAPAASAEAAALLRHAATAASRGPDLAPAPDQFVYVKSVETAAVLTGNSHGGITSTRMQTDLREIWQSADGSRTGVLKELPQPAAGQWQITALAGCRNGKTIPAAGVADWGGSCLPQPGYHAGLPTTASAMLGYLYRNSHGQNPPDVEAFITAGDLIRESYVQPAALAAVFGAAALIPGVTVVLDVRNAAGQLGIGVQQTFRGISEQLIFSPRTYAFIGERQVAVSAGAGLPVGSVLDSTAILATGIVDHAGLLPR